MLHCFQPAMITHVKEHLFRLLLYAIMAVFIGGSARVAEVKITVYLIGDSTMAAKRTAVYPETGWGTPFAHYFTDQVLIENHARNGRSSRSFREEGLWDVILDQLKEGDYVFIQFGHNDASRNRPERFSTEEQYKMNLRTYVRETRDAGANPVLLTPIVRRHFDQDGNLIDTHRPYSDQMRLLAREENVPLIDMDEKSRELLHKLGREISRFLYLHLEPGQNPNYPEGVRDNTHFSELGGRMMTELVLMGIMELQLGLADHIVSR